MTAREVLSVVTEVLASDDDHGSENPIELKLPKRFHNG
jgi:hypothetical protein